MQLLFICDLVSSGLVCPVFFIEKLDVSNELHFGPYCNIPRSIGYCRSQPMVSSAQEEFKLDNLPGSVYPNTLNLQGCLSNTLPPVQLVPHWMIKSSEFIVSSIKAGAVYSDITGRAGPLEGKSFNLQRAAPLDWRRETALEVIEIRYNSDIFSNSSANKLEKKDGKSTMMQQPPETSIGPMWAESLQKLGGARSPYDPGCRL
ncbi:hypothetical protein EDD18DRAFT_1113841 [Armillaria luteobubalina]|uniref:Uncharacterized protein n=1 Tax=Armillaria luteobubalina TaxID=153913 RepID=A0AA39UHS8_9AGAR|nr:hypothetical protein EDD18DRAFT_1113841 [Armillaria luteobubalina]